MAKRRGWCVSDAARLTRFKLILGRKQFPRGKRHSRPLRHLDIEICETGGGVGGEWMSLPAASDTPRYRRKGPMPTRRSARKCALTSPPPYRAHCCRHRRRSQHSRQLAPPPRLWRPRGHADDDTRTTGKRLTSRLAVVSISHLRERNAHFTQYCHSRESLARAMKSVMRSVILITDRRPDIDHRGTRPRTGSTGPSAWCDRSMAAGVPIMRFGVPRKLSLTLDYVVSHPIATTLRDAPVPSVPRDRDNRRSSLRANFRRLEGRAAFLRAFSRFFSGPYGVNYPITTTLCDVPVKTAARTRKSSKFTLRQLQAPRRTSRFFRYFGRFFQMPANRRLPREFFAGHLRESMQKVVYFRRDSLPPALDSGVTATTSSRECHSRRRVLPLNAYPAARGRGELSL